MPKMFILYIVVVFCLFLIFSIYTMKKRKEISNSYLEQNPHAVKVFIKQTFNPFFSKQIIIRQVNDESPIVFNQGIKNGFFINPGNVKIVGTVFKSRPGFFYKRVNTSYDIVSEVVLEKNHDYILDFNKNTISFEVKQI